MNRIIEREVAGTKYLLNFSLKAYEEAYSKFGDIPEMAKAINDEKKGIENARWLFCVMNEQAAIYKKVVDGEKAETINFEKAGAVFGVKDMAAVKLSVLEAITAGMQKEIELEEDKKNAETTQTEK